MLLPGVIQSSAVLPGHYTAHNQVQLVRGGAPYFQQLLQLIANARQSIHLQTYIFLNDSTGQMVVEALVAAAARGVKVYLLLDSYGSEQRPQHWTNELSTQGIQFRWFSPLVQTSGYSFGRRMHHKVVVADAQEALVGGVNISDRYNDLPGQPAWLDWAVYCKGQVAAELYLVCQEMFSRRLWGKRRRKRLLQAMARYAAASYCPVRVRRNDWVRRQISITRSYFEMLNGARAHITIMSAYFLPGRALRKAMMRAAGRGVRIRIIAAGKSDVGIAKAAERYLYSWLLRCGVQLYEYQPQVLHAKLSCADDEWVTVGSYNINNLSAYASIELNLDIADPSFAQQVAAQLHTITEEYCKPVTLAEWEAGRSWWQRLKERLAYDLLQLSFVFFYFFVRKSREASAFHQR
ncbi:MAG: cardiolipin synthase ClsB [Chitinophagaceae bacterium]|jgi:cardiolipin synthase|nr:cardiolipin synthase ClsB [Chitinophagaceae bacterium]